MNTIYVSEFADRILKEYLQSAGYAVREVAAGADVDAGIAAHPDIYMCRLGDTVFHGDASCLGRDYPAHAIYNACSTGKFFIHNLKITAPALLKAANDLGLRTVHVAQGYAKCNCVVVDENSIITADRGIAKAAEAAGLDVLIVAPGQVELSGYPYGFLGGASGRIGNAVIFNGDISAHSDYAAIADFIKYRGLELIYFRQYPLTDIGSVIEEISL